MSNAFNNAVATKIGATPVPVLTVPDNATYVAITLSILITNRTGGRLPVNVQLSNPSRVDQPFICNQKRIDPNDSIDVIKATRIAVKPGESILVSTAEADAIDCVISYATEADL